MGADISLWFSDFTPYILEVIMSCFCMCAVFLVLSFPVSLVSWIYPTSNRLSIYCRWSCLSLGLWSCLRFDFMSAHSLLLSCMSRPMCTRVINFPWVLCHKNCFIVVQVTWPWLYFHFCAISWVVSPLPCCPLVKKALAGFPILGFPFIWCTGLDAVFFPWFWRYW